MAATALGSGSWRRRQSTWTDYNLPNFAARLTPVRADNYFSLNLRDGYKLTDHMTVSGTAEQFKEPRMMSAAGFPTERRLIAKLTAHF